MLSPFLRGLGAEDRRVAVAAINDPAIQAVAIMRVLRRVGYVLSDQVITNHRRGACKECAASGLLKPKVKEGRDR